MEEQKRQIMSFVEDQKTKGQTVTTILVEIGIKRSTYYKQIKPRIMELTPKEKTLIERVKEHHPHLRHRQIQGVLPDRGI
jgi:methylphosphotriester-DNA--protein-cysteine methyltransferase